MNDYCFSSLSPIFVFVKVRAHSHTHRSFRPEWVPERAGGKLSPGTWLPLIGLPSLHPVIDRSFRTRLLGVTSLEFTGETKTGEHVTSTECSPRQWRNRPISLAFFLFSFHDLLLLWLLRECLGFLCFPPCLTNTVYDGRVDKWREYLSSNDNSKCLPRSCYRGDHCRMEMSVAGKVLLILN